MLAPAKPATVAVAQCELARRPGPPPLPIWGSQSLRTALSTLEFWADSLEELARCAPLPPARQTLLSDREVLNICEDTWLGSYAWILDPAVISASDWRYREILDAAARGDPSGEGQLYTVACSARNKRYLAVRTQILSIGFEKGNRALPPLSNS